MKFHAPLAAVILLFSMPLQAEQIQISVSKQSPELQGIVRPTAGMKSADVERVFGAPQGSNGPVGEPPITTWFYPDFTVYFEYDTVLHSVLRNTPPPDKNDAQQ